MKVSQEVSAMVPQREPGWTVEKVKRKLDKPF